MILWYHNQMVETNINALKQATELLSTVLQRAQQFYKKNDAVRDRETLKDLEEKLDQLS